MLNGLCLYSLPCGHVKHFTIKATHLPSIHMSCTHKKATQRCRTISSQLGLSVYLAARQESRIKPASLVFRRPALLLPTFLVLFLRVNVNAVAFIFFQDPKERCVRVRQGGWHLVRDQRYFDHLHSVIHIPLPQRSVCCIVWVGGRREGPLPPGSSTLNPLIIVDKGHPWISPLLVFQPECFQAAAFWCDYSGSY